jgi:hypothetical protein
VIAVGKMQIIHSVKNSLLLVKCIKISQGPLDTDVLQEFFKQYSPLRGKVEVSWEFLKN